MTNIPSTTISNQGDSPAGSPPVREEPAALSKVTFDGVVCFGDSDWWYHNRGHYDMQMMRQLSRHVPVLYVNSIGLRMPRVCEGSMFLRRIRRKLESLRRGLVRVQDNFSVYSPLVVPGRLGMLCSRQLMILQIRWAIRRLHMRRPLVWVACPPAAAIVDVLAPAAVIYQRTDRYEDYPGLDAERIRRLDRVLKARADLTLFCSSYLLDREAAQCRRAVFADHGVDFDRFAAAGIRAESPEGPAADTQNDVSLQMAQIPRPRIGFVGGVDAHTFDPELFDEVACQMPQLNFVLVGACSLPAGWCRATNVTMLGQQPYEQVADSMAACDVLIMPWNGSDWIRACNPVKLKEYLAAGRPVVSTPFEELRRYDGLVRVARDSQEFIAHIRSALADPPLPQILRQRVRQETWTAKGQLVLHALAEAGIVPGH